MHVEDLVYGNAFSVFDRFGFQTEVFVNEFKSDGIDFRNHHLFRGTFGTGDVEHGAHDFPIHGKTSREHGEAVFQKSAFTRRASGRLPDVGDNLFE